MDIFNWIIILCILIIIVGLVLKIIIPDEENNTRQQAFTSFSPNKLYDDYYVGQKVIGLSARKGYSKFSIAGAYYRNLSIDMVGKFNGYVIAQIDNEYDPYALSVYNDVGVHLGFLPGGNKVLHQYIVNEEGKVHAYGYLGWDNGIYGEVCVETNKNLVTKRNKPYQVN